jgi:2-oxo-4-hydroxy-4-carboxy-5-ureidoimidazoline decarboxylase
MKNSDRTPRLLPLDQLNSATPIEFEQALRPLFEAAPPLAEALSAVRPFASYSDLIDRAEAIALAAPEADQIAIVNAHPRIGAQPATLSVLSRHEQGTEDSPVVLEHLRELNRAYEEKFGFRFMVFVNRRPQSAILEVLRERLERSRGDELRSGLEAMFLIARDRLSTLAAQ